MAAKSNLTAGVYQIEIRGKTHILKPTLAAFNRLASQGPYNDVSARILGRDAATIAVVIRHGLGWTDAQSRSMAEMMMKAGTHTLWEPCYRFFFSLFHAGKTMEEVADEQAKATADADDKAQDEDAEGNALTGA